MGYAMSSGRVFTASVMCWIYLQQSTLKNRNTWYDRKAGVEVNSENCLEYKSLCPFCTSIELCRGFITWCLHQIFLHLLFNHLPSSTLISSYQSNLSSTKRLNLPIMEQTFLHVAAPARAPAPFPFEKLPPELQQMVIREALPDHGLRPRRPPKGVHIGSSNYWDLMMNDYWCEEEEESFRDYLGSLKDATEEIRGVMVPLNLFLVSKSISTMTRSIYDNEIPFVINITPMCLHFLERIVNVNIEYPTYTADLPRYPHFLKLRNFELNFNHHPIWWRSNFQEQRNPADLPIWWKLYNPDHPIWWKQTKEWVRIICDVLSKNDSIDKLTIYLPCLCSLTTPTLIAKAETTIHDVLTPLKKLRITKGVKFVWLRRETTDWRAAFRKGIHVCLNKESLGTDLLKTLQTDLSRLDGEKSSPQEEI